MSESKKSYSELQKNWGKVQSIVKIIKNESQYNKAVKQLDGLIDEIGSDQNHPLATLMEVIGTHIESYEKDNIYIAEIDPIDLLKDLMKEHSLNQSDMVEIGTQGVVSEVLNKKRQLNARQISNLSKRFNVSPAVFIR